MTLCEGTNALSLDLSIQPNNRPPEPEEKPKKKKKEESRYRLFRKDGSVDNDEVDLLFKACDLDGDGVLDWHDFLMVATDRSTVINEFNLQDVFSSFDTY
jgi:hypothetical protein